MPKKIKLNINKRLIAIIAAVILALALIITGFVIIKNKFFSAGSINQLGNMTVAKSSEIHAFNGGFVYLNGSTLYCVDAKGNDLWNVSLETSEPKIGIASKRVAVYQNEWLYMYASDGTEIYKKPLNIEIADVECGVEDVALLNKNRDTIYVLNRNGGKIDEIVLPNQTIINMGFYSTSELLWVVSVNTQGSSPESTVSVWLPQSSVVAMQTFSDEIIYDLAIEKGASSVIAVGTKSVTPIDTQTGTSGDVSTLIYGYQQLCSSTAGSEHAAVIMAPTQQCVDGYVTDIISVRSDKKTPITLPEGCSAFLATDKYIYCAAVNGVYVLSYEGELVNTIAVEGEYNFVRAVGASHFVYYGSENTAKIVKITK